MPDGWGAGNGEQGFDGFHHFGHFNGVDSVRAGQNHVLGAPGAPVVEIGRSEQDNHRAAESGGDMGGSAVVSNE